MLLAISCLQNLLAAGPFLASLATKFAEASRISPATLYRAKKHLGIRSQKTATGWFWVLPQTPPPTLPTMPEEVPQPAQETPQEAPPLN